MSLHCGYHQPYIHSEKEQLEKELVNSFQTMDRISAGEDTATHEMEEGRNYYHVLSQHNQHNYNISGVCEYIQFSIPLSSHKAGHWLMEVCS